MDAISIINLAGGAGEWLRVPDIVHRLCPSIETEDLVELGWSARTEGRHSRLVLVDPSVPLRFLDHVLRSDDRHIYVAGERSWKIRGWGRSGGPLTPGVPVIVIPSHWGCSTLAPPLTFDAVVARALSLTNDPGVGADDDSARRTHRRFPW